MLILLQRDNNASEGSWRPSLADHRRGKTDILHEMKYCGCLVVHKRTHVRDDFHRTKMGQPLLQSTKMGKRLKVSAKIRLGKHLDERVER